MQQIVESFGWNFQLFVFATKHIWSYVEPLKLTNVWSQWLPRTFALSLGELTSVSLRRTGNKSVPKQHGENCIKLLPDLHNKVVQFLTIFA